MDALAQALARFNRAEPDLLFRDAFGHWDTQLRLSSCFRQRVAQAADIPCVPDNAWWAAEYPLSCLVGALSLYVEVECAVREPRLNSQALVRPGREDVDFIISFETELILIEAKAYTSNDNAQLKRKLDRLDSTRRFYLDLHNASERPIEFHFLLTSPAVPQNLDVKWPDWVCKGNMPPWIPLKLGNLQNLLQVTRCDPNGKSTREGLHWRAIPSRVFAPPKSGETI
jgi:hypothetical protein